MLHDTLWRSNLDLARSCLAHPFVQALGDGSLSADLFRGFVAQDTFFLRAFQKAYALALVRSEDAETIAVFCDLIAGVTEELNVHRTYAAELGINLKSVVPNPACGAYTDAYGIGFDRRHFRGCRRCFGLCSSSPPESSRTTTLSSTLNNNLLDGEAHKESAAEEYVRNEEHLRWKSEL